MTKAAAAIFTIAVLIPAAAAAQDPVLAMRTSGDQLYVMYEKSMVADAQVAATLLTPHQTPPGTLQMTGRVLADEHTVVFALAGQTALLAQAAAAEVTPLLLIPALSLDGEVAKNLLIPVPLKLGFELGDVTNHIIDLTATYLPAADAARMATKDLSQWQVTVDGTIVPISALVMRKDISLPPTDEDFERGLVLHLSRFVRNAADVIVKHRAGTGAEFRQVAKGTTSGAPEKTDADPVGDADIFVAFTYTAARTDHETNHIGGLQLHLARPIRYWGGSVRNLFELVPSFSALVHGAELDDEDSLNLKTTFRWLRFHGNMDRLPDLTEVTPGPAIHTTERALAAALEFSKGFKEGNAVASAQLSPQFKLYGKNLQDHARVKSLRTHVAPSAGFEGGRVLASSMAELEGTSIARIHGGFTSRFVVKFIDHAWADSITLTVNYTGRKLLKEEQFTKSAKLALPAGVLTGADAVTIEVPAGALVRNVVATVDKKPRHYVEANVALAVNANFEMFTKYTRGSLPPKFAMVNKFEAGFAYRYNAPW